MIDGALPHLRCPVCHDSLTRAGAHALRCPGGHTFDIARQGYANLTRGRMPHQGDSAAMVEARAAFLAAGHYRFVVDALGDPGGFIVDAGAGTGHYLAELLDKDSSATGLALDVAKPALRRAARAHPRAAAVLADLWQPLPIADGSADTVLNVFAPRNGAEFARVLKPGGVLVVVTPAADHLHELITGHGLLTVDPAKQERVAEALGGYFVAEHTATHRRTLTLTGDEQRTLIGMTPSARHVTVEKVSDGTVTAAVDVTRFRCSGRPLPSPAAPRDRDR